MLRKFLLTWLANFIGLVIAASFLRGIDADGFWVIAIASLIFGIINSTIRPILVILSLPAIVLTLGLFTLMVNALLLYLTSVIYKPFQVLSFYSAIGTVIILWFANYLMSYIIEKDN